MSISRDSSLEPQPRLPSVKEPPLLIIDAVGQPRPFERARLLCRLWDSFELWPRSRPSGRWVPNEAPRYRRPAREIALKCLREQDPAQCIAIVVLVSILSRLSCYTSYA